MLVSLRLMAVSVVFEVTEVLITEADISRLLPKHFYFLTYLARLGAVSVLNKREGDERTRPVLLHYPVSCWTKGSKATIEINQFK